MNFDKKYCLTKYLAIHIKTQQEADAIFTWADNEKIPCGTSKKDKLKWRSRNFWNDFKENTCVIFSEKSICHIDYFNEKLQWEENLEEMRKYTVVAFEDLIKDNA